MKSGLKLLISVALLSVGVGCGTPDDPSDKNNGSNNGGSNNGGNTNNGVDPNNNSNNGDTNNPDPNNTDTNNPNPNNTDTNNNDTNNGTPGVCEPNTAFFGQIGGDGDRDGGAPTTTPLATDAGLGAIMTAFTAMEEMQQTVDFQVTGAIVTATNFGTGGDSNFWVEDSTTAFQVFLGFDNPVAETVKVGNEVSFHVTELGNFGGNPQITVIDGFTTVSEGNEVPYLEKTGQALAATDFYKIVRISGTLGAVATDCGGSSKCYDLTSGTETLIYRTSSEFAEPGDCVTFVGPLVSFPGPKNDGGTTGDWQLDVKNFDWSFTTFD